MIVLAVLKQFPEACICKNKGKEYALRNVSGSKQTLYNANTRAGRPGDPVGEITMSKDT